jgi:hypothetical protein
MQDWRQEDQLAVFLIRQEMLMTWKNKGSEQRKENRLPKNLNELVLIN